MSACSRSKSAEGFLPLYIWNLLIVTYNGQLLAPSTFITYMIRDSDDLAVDYSLSKPSWPLDLSCNCSPSRHSASLLAYFMQTASPTHSDQANRLIMYLRDHENLSLILSLMVKPSRMTCLRLPVMLPYIIKTFRGPGASRQNSSSRPDETA